MGRRNAANRGRSWRAAREKAPLAPTDTTAIAERLPRSAPTGIIAMVTAIMLAWTWDCWPNLLIDFSRDLYTAAQLAQGKVLYRDIAFFTGPLSPYLNAVWLRLFGPTLQTLVACNMVLFVVFLWLLYQVLRRVGSRTAATAATVVFVTMFGLADLVPMGNYNFICPYSHDMVHGLALSLGSILCLARYTDALSPRLAVLAGVQLGLVFLTRAEISLPAWVACGLGLAATLTYDPRAHAKRWVIVAQVLAPALAVPLAALALLARHMPSADALRGVLGSWLWVFDAKVNALSFYRESIGLDDAALNLRRMLAWGLIYTLALVPFVVAALGIRAEQGRRKAVWFLVAATAAVFMSALWRHILPSELARPLPLFLVILALVTIQALGKNRTDPIAHPQLTARLMLVVLGLGLLGKILLNARFYNYGFVLAVPATMMLVLALLDWIPEAITRHGGSGSGFRLMGLALLAGFVVAHLQISELNLSRNTVTVGEGTNSFLSDGRANQVNALLTFLARKVPAGKTLAVVPEGAMINFLAQRVNPNPCLNLMPPEIASLGEAHVLQQLQKTPPEILVLDLDRISSEGLLFRNAPYAPQIAAWIVSNYELMERFETRPEEPMRLRLGVMQFRPSGQKGSGG
jgi:hypothetical protein